MQEHSFKLFPKFSARGQCKTLKTKCKYLFEMLLYGVTLTMSSQMAEHGSSIDATVCHRMCMKFVIAHFPLISRYTCSDIFLHIHIRIAIIGRLKTVFISVLKYSIMIYLSAAF
jgi:hypothetical protein